MGLCKEQEVGGHALLFTATGRGLRTPEGYPGSAWRAAPSTPSRPEACTSPRCVRRGGGSRRGRGLEFSGSSSALPTTWPPSPHLESGTKGLCQLPRKVPGEDLTAESPRESSVPDTEQGVACFRQPRCHLPWISRGICKYRLVAAVSGRPVFGGPRAKNSS